MTSKPCVTIYTDASLCHATKVGGWGCWIKYAPGDAISVHGAFKTTVGNSDEAELMAIANGLHVALKRVSPEQKTLFVVVTDSQHAINYIEHARKRDTWRPGNKRKKLHEKKFLLAKAVLAMLPEGHALKVNKVKAHSGKDGARSWCNRVVDKAAKSAMQQKRGALKNEH